MFYFTKNQMTVHFFQNFLKIKYINETLTVKNNSYKMQIFDKN